MSGKNPGRVIRAEAIIDAGLDRVWDAWTTERGVKSFLAPACNIELRIDGPYEIFFDPEAEPGRRGGKGVRILAFDPRRMLSITRNAPPHLSEVRKQWTHVTVRSEETRKGQIRVTLTHDPWGEGKEWGEAFAYFTRAWVGVVLSRLKYRFSVSPIDWKNPTQIGYIIRYGIER